MKNYEEMLQIKVDSGEITGISARRAKRLLALPESNPRRAKALQKLEDHSRAHLGLPATGNVDWSAKNIDWNSLIDLIAKLLPMILNLLKLFALI